MGFPLLAPEGVLTMMGHSRDFLLMSRFNSNIVNYLKKFFHSFKYSFTESRWYKMCMKCKASKL